MKTGASTAIACDDSAASTCLSCSQATMSLEICKCGNRGLGGSKCAPEYHNMGLTCIDCSDHQVKQPLAEQKAWLDAACNGTSTGHGSNSKPPIACQVS